MQRKRAKDEWPEGYVASFAGMANDFERPSQNRRRGLRSLLDDFEAMHGPLSQEEMKAARRKIATASRRKPRSRRAT